MLAEPTVQVVFGGRQILPDVSVARAPEPQGAVAVLSAAPDEATMVQAAPQETREEFIRNCRNLIRCRPTQCP